MVSENPHANNTHFNKGDEMIINNNIAGDNYTERAERIQLLSTNIDTYAAELGIAGDKLTACQNADTEWENACAKATVEDGQMDEAFETFQQSVKAAANYYRMAKDHLLTIIYEAEGAPDDFIHAYGFDVDSPRRYKKLTAAIEAWKRNHDFLIGENDTRVVTDAIMTNLMTHKTTIDTLSNTAFIEREESDMAFSEKQALYDVQTRLLQFVLTTAILTWGDDAPKLRLLGFCPSSEVWTKKKPYAPKNFAYDDVASRFNWDIVMDVDSYEVDFRLTGASGDWTTLYEGVENFTTKKPPDPGEYDFRVRAIAEGKLGAWSGVLLVNFHNGGVLPAPNGFKFDDTTQVFLWKIVIGADRYQLEYSRDGGQTWTIKYEGAAPKFDATDMDSGKYLFRVRALNATETSPWGITLEVWLGVPNVPGNMRWHPEEYHGDMFAKIEWDAAAGATEYQLDYINDGESFNTGANTFKYEDIIGLPREHEYKVRAGNGFGWSEFSPVFVIVLA